MFALFAASLPVIVFIASGRQLVSVYRSLRRGQAKMALLSVLSTIGLLVLFVFVAGIWFVYGVSHSAKPIFMELVLVVITATTIYGASFGLWFLARRIDERSSSDSA